SPRRPAPTPRGPAEGAPPPRRPRVRRVRCASWRYLLLGERQRLLPLEAEFLRSEEHTSELQSPCNIVCRLLLEKKYNSRRSAIGFSRIYALAFNIEIIKFYWVSPRPSRTLHCQNLDGFIVFESILFCRWHHSNV